MQTLRSYHSYLNDGRTLLPGEGARILTFVLDVIRFINDLKDTNGTGSPADLIYSIVDRVGLQKDAVMNEMVSGPVFFLYKIFTELRVVGDSKLEKNGRGENAMI